MTPAAKLATPSYPRMFVAQVFLFEQNTELKVLLSSSPFILYQNRG
jgi:hypothetical protein